jgi:hypothetical protein
MVKISIKNFIRHYQVMWHLKDVYSRAFENLIEKNKTKLWKPSKQRRSKKTLQLIRVKNKLGCFYLHTLPEAPQSAPLKK